MSALPQQLRIAGAATLETALNQVFKLDPALLNKLDKISGKVIQITFSGPDVSLFFLPDNLGIAVQAEYAGHADCAVQGNPSDFVELFLAEDAASALINGGITVRGESSLLLNLQAVFSDMQLDWEYELSKVIGDIAAHQVGQSLRAGTKVAKDTASKVQDDIKAKIDAGDSILPSKQEVRRFCDDVDAITARLEHLEAKFNAYLKPKR